MFAEVSVRELTKRASADEATDVIVLNCLTRIGAQRGEYVVAVRVRIASRRRRDRLHFSPWGIASGRRRSQSIRKPGATNNI